MSTALYTPTPAAAEGSNLGAFARFVAAQHPNVLPQPLTYDAAGYAALHNWSVTSPNAFWGALWSFCKLEGTLTGADQVFLDESAQMRDIPSWMPGATLNYAQNMLRHAKQQPDAIALTSIYENPSHTPRYKIQSTHTFGQLESEVATLATALRGLGLGSSDAIGAYVPNCASTAVSALAAAAVGCVFSTTAPDFAPRAVLDRLGQVRPRALFAADLQHYRGKTHQLASRVAEIAKGLETLEYVIVFPFGHDGHHIEGLETLQQALKETKVKVLVYHELLASAASSVPTQASDIYASLSPAHPLYILYTSGTTGAPKCLVHSHGGTLLKHTCEEVLHCGLTPSDTMLYYTTTAWMMWHWQLSGIGCGSHLVMYDGSPFTPGPEVLFDAAADLGVTVFGTSAKYIAAVLDAGFVPRNHADLSRVRQVLSTGSPLMPDCFDFVYSSWSPAPENLLLASISGGTDILGCFVGGCPWLPVHRGEIQCVLLGMAVESWDPEKGTPVRDVQGELVCTRAFPSMPVAVGSIAHMSDRTKYHASYFGFFQGNVWCHGDWVMVRSNNLAEGYLGGIVMYGRSDATLNPGGVRFGSAELYNVVERLTEIQDSVVVAQRLPRGDDERVVMFVKMAPGHEFDEKVKDRIRSAIRTNLSARHVPSVIVPVADIPYTVNGKKVEVAVKRVLHGEVFNVHSAQGAALANPQALELYKNIPEVMQF